MCVDDDVGERRKFAVKSCWREAKAPEQNESFSLSQ